MNTVAAAAPVARVESHRFYLWMAGAFVIVAFGGFTPTFWAKVGAGTFHAPPIVYVHGMLLFSWTCFFFVQTALVSAGRTMSHRSLGLAGIALFTALMCSILVTENTVMVLGDAAGMGDAARRFAAVTLCGWGLLAVLATLAFTNIRRPEFHKRYMMLIMIGMMTPAFARVFITLFAPPGAAASGPPPPFVSIPPSIVADLFLVAALVRDWRTLGRPHPVYVYGGLALFAQQMLTVPFAATSTWMTIARAFQSLAG